MTTRRRPRRPDQPRRTRWLGDDLTRSWLTLPLLVVVWLLTARAPVAEDDLVLARLLAVYAVLLVLYPALTLAAFAGLSGECLTRALGESRRRQLRRPRWARRLVTWRDDDVGGDGPSWPVVLALVALVVSIWLVVSDRVHGSPFLLGTSIVMVVAAWGGSVVAYAVHTARLDAVAGGLRFPGDDGERAFSDYLYLALGVQAAFGPSDVQVTSRRMRRTLAGHMLVGWVFNTVVVAALVSFLVGLR